jgi:hypothetical protein
MKEADLFRQFAKQAMRWSSSKSTSADEKMALINLACRYEQAALMSEGVVLGSSFIPSPRHPALKETHPVLDLFMNDTCPRCRKPIKLAVIEQHPIRRDLVVHKFRLCGPRACKNQNPVPEAGTASIVG